jgi:hypothetical protein
MGINQIGRARAQGVGQQDLTTRLPARSASASTVIFQRGAQEPVIARRVAMSMPAKTKTAQQAVTARSESVLPPKAASIASGSVKNPLMPRVLTAQPRPTGLPKPILTSGLTSSGKTRELLSNPDHKAFVEERRPGLVKNKKIENLDFLQDLKTFRENPTIELAKTLKKTYVDPAGDDFFDMRVLKADDFNKDFTSNALNISSSARKGFMKDFDSCLKQLERGESFNRSGMAHVFNEIEIHISSLLLKDLQL